MKSSQSRPAFTLVELLVVIAIIGILLVCFCPQYRLHAKPLDALQCTYGLKQLGLALHNYESAAKRFLHLANKVPSAGPGAFAGTSPRPQSLRVSGFVALLPYIEQAPMYNQIQNGDAANAPGGPRGWLNWTVWDITPSTLNCPSDNYSGTRTDMVNYAFCAGDQIDNNRDRDDGRGVFTRTNGARISQITDGTSNTIAMSEKLKGDYAQGTNPNPLIRYGMVMGINVRTAPGDCVRSVTGDRYTNAANAKSRFGRIGMMARQRFCGFTTITPHKRSVLSEDINVKADTAHSILAPTSNHTGGGTSYSATALFASLRTALIPVFTRSLLLARMGWPPSRPIAIRRLGRDGQSQWWRSRFAQRLKPSTLYIRGVHLVEDGTPLLFTY